MKPGTGALTMGHIAITRPKQPLGSVLTNAPREGFTEYAARFFQTAIPVDEVSDAEAKLLQARMDFAATVAAIHSGKRTAAIRRAVVVNRN